LLTLEQDDWVEKEADNLGLSVGAYFRALADDDRKRKEFDVACLPLSPHDRAERRRETIQKPIHNDDDISLAVAIANAIKASRG